MAFLSYDRIWIFAISMRETHSYIGGKQIKDDLKEYVEEQVAYAHRRMPIIGRNMLNNKCHNRRRNAKNNMRD